MTMLPPLVLELRTKFQESYADIKKTGHEVDELNAKTEGGMGRTKKAFTGAATVGKAALFGIAGAAAVVGVESLKLGTDFQEATTQLVTGAGESEENIGKVRKGLLEMAPAVGMGPEALAKGMFLVESAGFHAADGLTVMKAAAEGAKIGGADATVVANGLTTALSDYHLPATKAADVTSKLVATVAAGKTSMADLAGSLSSVLPTAAAAHVGLEQVLGAMGTMTGEGISAQQASQDLAGTIRALGNPSAVATKAMAQMGLNSIDVAKNLGKKGLTGTLDELTEAILHHMGPSGLVLQSSFNQSKLAAQSAKEMLKELPPSLQKLAQGYLDGTVKQKDWQAALRDQPALVANLGKQFSTTAKQAHGFADDLRSGSGSSKTFNAMLSDMTGGATGLATSLALTGGNMKTFEGNVDKIGEVSAEAGGHVEGWKETQKDFAVQMAQAKAGVEAMGVKIGLALIPQVQKAIAVGTKWTDFLIAHKPLLYTIAGVIGTVLTLAIAAYVASLIGAAVTTTASAGTMIAGWLGIEVAADTAAISIAAATLGVGLAIAALVVGIIYVAKHWDTIWGGIKKTAVDAEHWAEDIFHNKFTQILIGVTMPLLFLGLHWRQVWSDMQAFGLGVWHRIDDQIVHPLQTGFHDTEVVLGLFERGWSRIWHWVGDEITSVWNQDIEPVVQLIENAVSKVSGAVSTVSHVAGSVSGGLGKVGGFLGFDEGGRVPGAPGAPMLAVVHGGEYVLSNDMQAGRKPIDNRVFPGGFPTAGGGGITPLGVGGRNRGAGSGGGETVIHEWHFYLDGKEIQANVQTHQTRVGFRRGTAYQGGRR